MDFVNHIGPKHLLNKETIDVQNDSIPEQEPVSRNHAIFPKKIWKTIINISCCVKALHGNFGPRGRRPGDRPMTHLNKLIQNKLRHVKPGDTYHPVRENLKHALPGNRHQLDNKLR